MQQATTDEIRRDIEETRARVSQALAELDGEITSRKDAVQDRIAGARESVTGAADSVQTAIVDFAREHPWYALGAAVGLGLLIGRSGADEAAAKAALDGGKAAAQGLAGAAAGAAKAGADKARSLVHPDHSGHSVAGEVAHDPQLGAVGSSAEDTGQVNMAPGGLLDRLQSQLADAVARSGLVEEMKREAAKLSEGHLR